MITDAITHHAAKIDTALHVGGVVSTSFRLGENLARAMVTGDKRAPGPGDIT